MVMLKRVALLLSLSLLSACASGPQYDTRDVDLAVTPRQAVAESDLLRGKAVLWGGVIIASSNLQDMTQFEILAYPLDSRQRPQTDRKPLGRFIAQQPGYLEVADYTQGRLLTVTGRLDGTLDGRIGESDYTYPVVTAVRHYLWSESDGGPRTSVHFGIGVLFHD